MSSSKNPHVYVYLLLVIIVHENPIVQYIALDATIFTEGLNSCQSFFKPIIFGPSYYELS